mgnify:CR=1 FL=1
MDVVVLFDGSGQEPDKGRRTNVYKFGERFGDVVLYEPGVGTWSGVSGRTAAMLGIGLYERVDDMLDRLEFYRYDKIHVVGGSRGGTQALDFCWRYEERYSAQVGFCGLYDVVRAFRGGAVKRLLPRALWGGRRVHRRPPVGTLVHATAGHEPNRFYAHDTVKGADHEWVFPGLEHGQVLRHNRPRLWLEGHAARVIRQRQSHLY